MLQPCSYQDSYYHYLFHQIYIQKSILVIWSLKKNKRHDINEGVDVHDLKTSFEKWNFVKLAKPLIGVSILIVVVGLVILYIFKLNLGMILKWYTRRFQSKQAITQQKAEQVVKIVDLKRSNSDQW